MDVPALPGYDVESPLDSAGTTWRARQQASGRPVLLRLVPLPPEPAGRDVVRRAAARIGGLTSRYLLPLHTVVTTGEGLVLVHDYPAGGTLTSLLAARQRLSPGEVATVGLALTDALADVHAAGQTHGVLAEASVYLGLDGTPLLSGAALPGSAAGGSPADDLRAVSALCQRALGNRRAGAVDGAAPLRQALTAFDKRSFADAGALTAALRTAPAVPVRLAAGSAGSVAVGPEAGVERPESARSEDAAADSPGSSTDVGESAPADSTGSVSRPVAAKAVGNPSLRARVRTSAGRRSRIQIATAGRGRLVGMAGAGAAVLLAAIAVGIGWGHHSSGPVAASLPLRSVAAAQRPTPTRPPTQPPAAARPSAMPPTPSPVRAGPSWRAVLVGLDRARAAAFERVDAAAMGRVDAPRSAALTRDRAALAELRRRGAHAAGLRWEVLDVTVDSAGPPGVTLRVTDRMPAYDFLDAAGKRLATRPPRGEAVWRITLLPAASGWRLAAVIPA